MYFSLYDKNRAGDNLLCVVQQIPWRPPGPVPRTRRLQRHVHGWLFGLQRSSLPVINCAPRLRVASVPAPLKKEQEGVCFYQIRSDNKYARTTRRTTPQTHADAGGQIRQPGMAPDNGQVALLRWRNAGGVCPCSLCLMAFQDVASLLDGDRGETGERRAVLLGDMRQITDHDAGCPRIVRSGATLTRPVRSSSTSALLANASPTEKLTPAVHKIVYVWMVSVASPLRVHITGAVAHLRSPASLSAPSPFKRVRFLRR